MATHFTEIEDGDDNGKATWNNPMNQLDAAIVVNDGKVTSNAAAIESNQLSNDAAIAENAADITANDAEILANQNAIAINESAIATNAADIDTNTAGIAVNVSDIAALSIMSSGTASTTVNGTQSPSTTMNVTDGSAFVDSQYISYQNSAGGLEYRQIVSGGGTNAFTLDAAHGGVTDGDTVSSISASEYLAKSVFHWGTELHHPMAYGANGDGVTDDRATLDTLVNTTMGGSGTLIIDRNYLIDSAMTFPVGVVLQFTEAGTLIASDGIEITIDSTVDAGPNHIFDISADTGAKTTAFILEDSATDTIYPQWWGALADGGADDYAAIRAATVSGSGRKILFGPSTGDYMTSDTIFAPSQCTVEFTTQHYLKTYSSSAVGGILLCGENPDTGGAVEGVTLINPRVDGNNVPGENGLGFKGNGFEVRGGHIKNFLYSPTSQGGKGVSCQTGVDNLRVSGTYVSDTSLAFDIHGNASGACRNVIFSSITAEDCAVALSVYCQTAIADQTAEYNLAVVNGLAAINCGAGTEDFFRTWTATTAYTAGQLTHYGGYWFYCNVSGTSGSGLGPSNGVYYRGQYAVDGTCTWSLVETVIGSGGVITSDQGAAIAISNVNVVNDNPYTTQAITAATAASPCEITSADHGLETGDSVWIHDIVGDMGSDATNGLNGQTFVITKIGTARFYLDGTDTSGLTYTSGGTIHKEAVGGLYRGNGSYITLDNATVHGDVNCIVNGEQWNSGWGSAASVGQMRYSEFTNIRHYGTAANAVSAHRSIAGVSATEVMQFDYFDIRTDGLLSNILSESAAVTGATAKDTTFGRFTDSATMKVREGFFHVFDAQLANDYDEAIDQQIVSDRVAMAALKMTPGSSGDVYIDTVTAGRYINFREKVGMGGIQVPSSNLTVFADDAVEESPVFDTRDANRVFSMRVYAAISGTPYASADTTMKILKNGTSNRSISAAGTVDVNGADYAEYEHKADGCGTIEKGDVVGYDADGLLTDKWAGAMSFGIKSTLPSFVGGDTWTEGLEERPEDGDPALAEWTERFEALRQNVDRIAYSGKVPVNVTGTNPGQYIIAAEGPDGGIIGTPITTPTTKQYRFIVGRVRRVLPDLRAEVSIIAN